MRGHKRTVADTRGQFRSHSVPTHLTAQHPSAEPVRPRLAVVLPRTRLEIDRRLAGVLGRVALHAVPSELESYHSAVQRPIKCRGSGPESGCLRPECAPLPTEDLRRAIAAAIPPTFEYVFVLLSLLSPFFQIRRSSPDCSYLDPVLLAHRTSSR